MHPALARTQAFCARYCLRMPILLAPMAGASAPSSQSPLPMPAVWPAAHCCRSPPPSPPGRRRCGGHEGPFPAQPLGPRSRAPARCGARGEDPRLPRWLGPEVPPDAGDARPPDFAAQARGSARSGAPGRVLRHGPLGHGGWRSPRLLRRRRRRGRTGRAVRAVGRQWRTRSAFLWWPPEESLTARRRGCATAGRQRHTSSTGFLRCPEAELAAAWANALARTPPREDAAYSRLQWPPRTEHRH